MDSNKNDRARFVFKNSKIYDNIAIIYLYQCFLNFSSSVGDSTTESESQYSLLEFLSLDMTGKVRELFTSYQ